MVFDIQTTMTTTTTLKNKNTTCWGCRIHLQNQRKRTSIDYIEPPSQTPFNFLAHNQSSVQYKHIVGSTHTHTHTHTHTQARIHTQRHVHNRRIPFDTNTGAERNAPQCLSSTERQTGKWIVATSAENQSWIVARSQCICVLLEANRILGNKKAFVCLEILIHFGVLCVDCLPFTCIPHTIIITNRRIPGWIERKSKTSISTDFDEWKQSKSAFNLKSRLNGILLTFRVFCVIEF